MLTAAWWAGIAASTLVIGALLGSFFDASPRVIGLVMGFGAGALVASVSFELTEEAYATAGGRPVAWFWRVPPRQPRWSPPWRWP